MQYPNNNSNTQDAFLMECVELSPLTLDDGFCKLPGQMAYWNGQYSDVYRAYQESKLQRDQLYRSLYTQNSAYLRSQNAKTTVGDIEAAIESTAAYAALRSDEVQLEAETKRLAGVCEAMRAKLQMLISLGAHIRAEFGNDPSLRRQAAAERTSQMWPTDPPVEPASVGADDDPLLR